MLTPPSKICFVGPMVGKHPGMVTTQGEILADLLAAKGHPVLSVSSQRNRYRRLWDIAATLVKRRKQIRVQCIQVYGGPSFVVEDMASYLGKAFGHKLIFHLHGGAMPEFMAKYPNWTRRVLSRADAIVTPSAFLARAVGEYGLTAEIIPNVIELKDYPYRERARMFPRLFWMRTFHPVWNPLMAVRVLALLKREFPEATLVMAGEDKGMRAETEALADSLGVRGSLQMAGFLNMEGKARAGTAADVFINTNRVDNTPVAVLEACAMGLPVVSTRVGGIPDLLEHGETGLLVNDDNPEEMALAIARLLRDPELAARLSRQGRALAINYSWENVEPRWKMLFQRLSGNSVKEIQPCAVLQE